MDVTCEFCLNMSVHLPLLGSSKVLFSIILARHHDAGHVDPDAVLTRSLDLIVEMAGLRLEVAQARQQLLSKEVETFPMVELDYGQPYALNPSG